MTMTTGQQLRAIRAYLSHDRRITQAEFAKWLGTSRAAYSEWERDKRPLSVRDRLLVRLMYHAMIKGLLKGFYWGER
jgi:DNA-binding transcriptional regulator YiaG